MYLPPLAYPLLGPLAWLPFWGSATLPTGDWSRIIFHFITPNTPRRRRSEARTKVQHSWLVKCCNMWHNTSFNSEIPFIYIFFTSSDFYEILRGVLVLCFPTFYVSFLHSLWTILLKVASTHNIDDATAWSNKQTTIPKYTSMFSLSMDYLYDTKCIWASHPHAE